MSRRHAETQPCRTQRDSREHNRSHHYAHLAETAGRESGSGFVLEDDRNDSGFGMRGIVTEFNQTLAKEVSIFANAFDALGFFTKDGQRFANGGDGRWR